MSNIFEFTRSGSFVEVDDGTYRAHVADIVHEEEGQYGPRLRFVFRLDDVTATDGGLAEVWAWCSAKASTKSNLGKWAQSILGRSLNIGERLRLPDLIGRPCQVFIENRIVDGNMRPRIERVMAAAPGGNKQAGPAAEADEAPFRDDDACVVCGDPTSIYSASGKPLCEHHGSLLS